MSECSYTMSRRVDKVEVLFASNKDIELNEANVSYCSNTAHMHYTKGVHCRCVGTCPYLPSHMGRSTVLNL